MKVSHSDIEYFTAKVFFIC